MLNEHPFIVLEHGMNGYIFWQVQSVNWLFSSGEEAEKSVVRAGGTW
jgi:hypothetical protein